MPPFRKRVIFLFLASSSIKKKDGPQVLMIIFHFVKLTKNVYKSFFIGKQNITLRVINLKVHYTGLKEIVLSNEFP